MKKSVLFVSLLALGIVWGVTIPLTKIVTSTGHHPIALVFWQLAIASILLAFIIIIRRSKVRFDLRHLIFFTVIAFSGTLIPNSISYYTVFHLPAGVMALLIALVPMFSLLVALIFKLERFQFLRSLGVLIGAAAIAIIVLPESSLPDPSKAIYVLITLIAPFCYGLEANYLAVKQPRDTGPFATLFGSSLIGLAITAPIVYFGGIFVNPMDGMGLPEWSLVATTIMHVVAYAGYIWLVAKAGPVFASQIAYIVTPAGVLLSVVILDEAYSPYIWLALILLIAGLALVNPKDEAPDANQTPTVHPPVP